MNIFEVLQQTWADLCADFQLNFIDGDGWKIMLSGLGVTFQITLFALLLGIVIGFLVAIVRSTYDKTGKMRFLNAICKVYLTIIRGTPVVVQLLIIYYVIFGSVDIDKTFIAVLSFGINSGAYVSEIIRAGIESIPRGQMEAGRSLGLNFIQTMWYIILPQAIKNILPSLGNELIVMVKETSVISVIAVNDLTKQAQYIESRTWDTLPPLFIAGAFYLLVTLILTWLQGKLERRLNHDRH